MPQDELTAALEKNRLIGSGVRSALVTGATGFVGSRLVAVLQRHGIHLTVASRDQSKAKSLWSDSVACCQLDLTSSERVTGICDGIDTVFHLAGYAHADDGDSDALTKLHRQVTVDGTDALLLEAARAAVRRFVFLSSTKAMSEGDDRRLDEQSPAVPLSAYGRAKREAELLVLKAGAKYGMHVCVLRLPLVYGPGVKGNLLHMIGAIDRGRFPPLPEVRNCRSMVHVEDVVQALRLAVENPKANGEVYLVTDGRAYSTYEICALIRRALGKAEPTWKVPIGVLRAAAGIGDAIGRIRGRPFFFNSVTLNKLIGSAWYSSEKIERDLGFRPTHILKTALPEMVEEYRRKTG